MASTAIPNPEELKKRLEMDHLVPEKTEDLKAELQKLGEPATEELASAEDPKAKEEYTFQLDWTDGRGKRWLGQFTNRILSLRERQLVGLMRARFGGGMPSESLDDLTRELNLMLAHLAFSLVDKPDWAEELRDLKNIQLVQEIYGEVASHEAGFFGWGAPEG